MRKSVSVHGEKITVSESLIAACASARDSGAGPRITLPSSLYCDPWHGHLNLFSALFHGTTQPRCVQTALRPKSAMEPSSLTMMYVASPWFDRERGSERDGQRRGMANEGMNRIVTIVFFPRVDPSDKRARRAERFDQLIRTEGGPREAPRSRGGRARAIARAPAADPSDYDR